MNKQVEKILEPLSPNEKLDIIEYLTESLEEKEIPLSDTQHAIIRKREVKYKAGNTILFTWDEVKESVKR